MITPVKFVKTLEQYAPKLVKTMGSKFQVSMSVADAVSITKSPQLRTKFAKPMPAWMEKLPIGLSDALRERVTYEVPAPKSALTDVLKDFADKFAGTNAKITLTKEATKQEGSSIIRTVIKDGDTTVLKSAIKVSGSEVSPQIKSGANIMGEAYHFTDKKKTNAEIFSTMAKNLGVDKKTALERAAKAQAMGENTKDPKTMLKVIQGDFEKPIYNKKGVNRYSHKSEDSSLPQGSRTLQSWFGMGYRRLL